MIVTGEISVESIPVVIASNLLLKSSDFQSWERNQKVGHDTPSEEEFQENNYINKVDNDKYILKNYFKL